MRYPSEGEGAVRSSSFGHVSAFKLMAGKSQFIAGRPYIAPSLARRSDIICGGYSSSFLPSFLPSFLSSLLLAAAALQREVVVTREVRPSIDS